MSDVGLIYAAFSALIVVLAAVWAVAARDREERRHMALLAVAGVVWPLLLVVGVYAAVVSVFRGRSAA